MRTEPDPTRHLLPRFREEQSVQTPAPERTYETSTDERHIRLRGIPVIGSAGGAIRGTLPHVQVCVNEGR